MADPKKPEPFDKISRYDRQLRLWANDGQSRLESSHVCLINATVTGAETLKNLVLPGIGEFTIIDDRIVNSNDLTGNFFLQSSQIGMPIAQAMRDCLIELNPESKGHAVETKLSHLLSLPQSWLNFSVVVVCGNLTSTELELLQSILWQENIPLFIVATCGFYGSLRIIRKQATVIETHDPSKTFDLRIDRPWPELEQFAASFDMKALDDTEHAHVPSVVIFIKALQQWKADHEGEVPRSVIEKRLFKAGYIEKMARNLFLETNFLEASRSVHRALQTTTIPNTLQQLFADVSANPPSQAHCSAFWLYVEALANYAKANEMMLPLPGNLPDMASTTSNYVKLQTLYKEKAAKDQADFQTELEKVVVRSNTPNLEILPENVAMFCKNAGFLYVSEGSLAPFSSAMRNSFLASEPHDLVIYFGLLALQDRQRLGVHDLKSLLNYFQQLTGASGELKENTLSILKEIHQHNNDNYTAIGSLMGGVAGQEILKVVTSQYIPLDNVYVFDGIRSSSSKWKV